MVGNGATTFTCPPETEDRCLIEPKGGSALPNLLGEDRQIDTHIDSAGVMTVPARDSQDGFELQFGSNYLELA